MLKWQWRSILEELNELQRHLSDPTCPCTLADAGEYCGQKHALGLHTLAKETIAMAPEYQEMLEELADEALTQHEALNTRIVCNVHDPKEKDTVLWARQWRKRIEPIYYRQCKMKNAAKLKQGEVQGYKTAISRTTAPAPLKWLKDNGYLTGEMLDYGSGKGCWYDMDCYDPYYQPLKPDKKYDTITCNYVLNVVSPEQEKFIVLDIQNMLKNKGNAYITVRRDLPELGKQGRDTFQRYVKLPYKLLRETAGYAIYTLKKSDAKLKQEPTGLCKLVSDATTEEAAASADYHGMSQEAKNAGLPDVAKTLNGIARQEKSHHRKLQEISGKHCTGLHLKQQPDIYRNSVIEWANGDETFFQALDGRGNTVAVSPTFEQAVDTLKITGKCRDNDLDNCQFKVTKYGKSHIIRRNVKKTDKTTCLATGIDELNEQRESLLNTGACAFKKKGKLKQEPVAIITGECDTDTCALAVKGKIETPGKSTSQRGLPAAIDDVLKSLEKRVSATDKTYAPGISTSNRYDFRFVLREMNDLIVSHDPFTFTLNPSYTAKLQPRQRERLANQSQVRKIAANLDPERLLLDTKSIDTGSPIINKDNLVLCGNGRVMSLMLAATEHPENISRYKQALTQIAPDYNIPITSITKMDMPVLVRLLLTKTDEQAFAEECNARPTIEASAIEKARTDAEKITPAMLNSLEVNEGESIEDALRARRNQPFVTAFISKLPENEQALLVDAKGQLNSDGVRRMGMAIFVSTFKGDTGLRLASQFFEALDTNVKNAFNGILRSLGVLSQAENLVASGSRDSRYAIGDDLARAIGVYSRLKSENMTVSKYLAQSQMLERELTPFQERILQVLDEHSRSAKRIGQILTNYAQSVIDSAPPGQVSMLGDIRATKEELFEQAIGKMKSEVEKTSLHQKEWLAKKLVGCKLPEHDQLTVFGWKPLREFITYASSAKNTSVNVCASGMVPGAYQIIIVPGTEKIKKEVLDFSKKVPGIKRVFSKDGGLTFEIIVPEESGQELMWKSQEIITKPARREPAAQGALFQPSAEMHDPLLQAIGCTIGVGCLASGKKPKSKLPVCSASGKIKRESCILDVKSKLPAGCNSKSWSKPKGEKPDGCVNPFAICTKSVGCRIKRTKEN
jgi:hypothetical protein